MERKGEEREKREEGADRCMVCESIESVLVLLTCCISL